MHQVEKNRWHPVLLFMTYPFRKFFLILLFVLLGGGGITGTSGQSYLSNLSASADDPLYTTYAAALVRSEFIVDEGYQFVWYDGQDGINFETDQAGNLSLGFKMNGDFRYFLNQMHTPPTVTTSYSDLVRYEYFPFENIKVTVFFLVYSSRIAIQDVEIANQRAANINLSVYPFLHNEADVFTDAALISGQDGFTIRHREPPDSWTISHGVPYVENLQDVFLLDTAAASWGAYSELGNVNPNPAPVPEGAVLQNYCVEWGRVWHSDGTPCTHTPPQAQQIVLHSGSDAEILTEEAPKWGDPDPNIPGNGFQGCELGHFDDPPIAPGDSFQVIFTCLATGEQGIGRGVVPQTLPAPAGVQLDIYLSPGIQPGPPPNLQAEFPGNTAFLHWNPAPNATYSVYRRNALSDTGEYDRQAQNLTDTVWVDFSIDPSQAYGYLVTARDAAGHFSGHSNEANNIGPVDFFSDVQDSLLSNQVPAGDVKVVALQRNLSLGPGETGHLRIIRGVTEADSSVLDLVTQCRNLRNTDLQPFLQADEQLYSHIPQLPFTSPDEEMMYWSAFNLMRQCMLPPEGQSSYNYYVFSREPTWGWGHGGQVFHESLTMLGYAYMDSLSAMNSQRVYMERQWPDGYINYRTGPYLNETIPYAGQYTSSAPWFNWENWEIYTISPDTLFLQEAYQSGKKFYQYWLNNRDSDNDGLCEWGAHAMLESVRDGQTAVWDQVGWPANFECLDLNVMLVSEAQALANMAQELGYSGEYQYWSDEAAARTDSINKYMWDAQTGFYYHVDKIDHDFTFNSTDDLKRQEIIGFLPLWAGVADSQQAVQLVQHLTDPGKFWRNYGIPTLVADDPYYNPMGYWNGPVWVQWQYLIFRGLLRYGYVNEARQLADNVFDQVVHQLKTNHWFWELYSPDTYQAGHHKTYIWSALVARMLIDLENAPTSSDEIPNITHPTRFELLQNYPNPFNPATTIRFTIPATQRVKLVIFDILGRKVKTLLDEKMVAGHHQIMWKGKDQSGQPVASGVFFFRLQSGEFEKSRKMILLR